ncbi:hypothetical protein LMG28138_04980 [Pararobbsia alpina]|uniref:Uncharacterized protein n=1 Tax=Pararobbsia alpina TaxID=621374 RepID=A0A6S7BI72_9BURK|nr:hypothetical protein LMG28138_04980 [Pararobbsia alpina]
MVVLGSKLYGLSTKATATALGLGVASGLGA